MTILEVTSWSLAILKITSITKITSSTSSTIISTSTPATSSTFPPSLMMGMMLAVMVCGGSFVAPVVPIADLISSWISIIVVV